MEITPPAGSGETVRWIPDVVLGRLSHAALLAGPGTRIAYEVHLPAGSRVGAWCAVTARDADRDPGLVKFEIAVRTPTSEVSARCVLAPRSSSRDGWRLLRLTVPGCGPARILFSATPAGTVDADSVSILWGDPFLDTPRPLTELLSYARAALSGGSLRSLWRRAAPGDVERSYAGWVARTEPSARDLAAQRMTSDTRSRTFSIVTVVSGSHRGLADDTIASVLGQTHTAWEWIVVSPNATINAPHLTSDGRIRIVAGPAASESDTLITAFAAARGEFALLLGPSDTLSASALFEIASALERRPDLDVVYSDEDFLADATGERHRPRFKPDWSPDRLLSGNYVGRLAAMRISTVVAAGGWAGPAASGEWELWLRLSRAGAHFGRIPRCLYHRRSGEGEPAIATPEADAILRGHFSALGLTASSTPSAAGPRPTWTVQGSPLVSVVIPNRNAATVLRQCVTGLLERTRHDHLELIVVDNGSTESEALDLYHTLESGGRTRIVTFDRPFNFSAACNAGAGAASGDLLLFLNNDVEVMDPEWLDELIRWAQRSEVGVVGAQLLYPDRLIQHAGVVFGLGLVGHIFARAAEGTSSLFGSPASYRNYSAVTGACHMMRRDVFDRLGGYDERFRLSFSDVVFCMEAWRAGYRVVYTPYARLIHHESYTRERQDSQDDIAMLARYLEDRGFVEDPFFHPELDPTSPVPALRPRSQPAPQQVVADAVTRALSATRAFTA